MSNLQFVFLNSNYLLAASDLTLLKLHLSCLGLRTRYWILEAGLRTEYWKHPVVFPRHRSIHTSGYEGPILCTVYGYITEKIKVTVNLNQSSIFSDPNQGNGENIPNG